MSNQLRLYLVSIVFICLSITTLAQDVCNELVTRALEKTSTNCQSPITNTICYGNGLIFAQARTGTALNFQQEGDIASIDDFAGITHSPLDEVAEIWGVSLMSLQANIPGTLPGQVVQIIVFGNVEVSDVSQSAFRFTTGVGTSNCAEAPTSGIMVRTPDGVAEIAVNINEIEITLGSTALIEANLEQGMTVTMLDGNARVTAQGITQPVSFSQQLNIPLMQDPDQNLIPAAPPSPAETWDAVKISKAFNVYNTLNKLGNESTPIESPTPIATTPIVFETATPTVTFTPIATLTPVPCTISTTATDVITRVGPGFNRGTFVFLEPNKPIPVTGKKFVNDDTWWQLDKFEVTTAASSVNELWVLESDVTEQGDCDQVIDVDAPPIVRIPPTAAPQPTATDLISPTTGVVPAVEPFILISVEDRSLLMGECTMVFVDIEFISEAYFDGPGFIADDTVEGPTWETEVCPPLALGTYTYTLDAFSLTGNLVQRFITIEVI